MAMRDLRVHVGALLLVALTACQSKEVMEEPRRGDLTGQEDGGSHGDGGPNDDGGGAGFDAGESCDGGGLPWDDGGTPWDAGIPEDGGSAEDGGPAPLACEKTQGVCAGAKRAWVDGAFETVCTARSYGADYEESESRCDGLDNDCDGVTDPSFTSRVTSMSGAHIGGYVSSLRTEQGVFVAVRGSTGQMSVLRLGADLSVQGTSSVPLPRTLPGESSGVLLRAQLVKTNEGLALFQAVEIPGTGGSCRLSLTPLDALGAPIPGEDGHVVEHLLFNLLEQSWTYRVEMSPSGDQVLVLWIAPFQQGGPRQVKGLVTDSRGQVLTAPRVLFTSAQGDTPNPDSVLWLRNGEVLVAMDDSRSSPEGSTVRVRRFDTSLTPIGVERTFEMSSDPRALLVDLGATRGGPVESPALVLRSREAPAWKSQVQVVHDLFNGGLPLTWAEAPSGEVAWYGALADEGVLRLAWLSVFKDHQAPPPGGDDWLGWNGRIWTQDEGHSAVDRSPGPAYLPLHRYAQWVLMEKLEPKRVGALYMTTTPEEGSFLDGVRYCVP
ncbi:putative metal-binding motif-containing protein [Myxococcus landrumensis]|uniref:Metal-binding motif-containing protein n=1 Tax=Myxococcus landrumensis TaxID=2813577 RepID=A0ABX7N0G4_9BACT|nr:putative metal-binding motif-containing protein [Myxococcus landrumus]QSQ12191.1 putative metal-binding motif-containing protein [Myxococcus landrumus]